MWQAAPNSWQLFPTPGGQRDDLAFAGALIDELVANWCADPARVYSTGMSNGGFFTARLVCEMADRIAAAVSVAGTYHPDSCHPARDVPYIAIHGTDDACRAVPRRRLDADGGRLGRRPACVLRAGDARGVRRVRRRHRMRRATVDTNVGKDVIRHEYTGCDGDTPMIFDEVRRRGTHVAVVADGVG